MTQSRHGGLEREAVDVGSVVLDRPQVIAQAPEGLQVSDVDVRRREGPPERTEEIENAHGGLVVAVALLLHRGVGQHEPQGSPARALRLHRGPDAASAATNNAMRTMRTGRGCMFDVPPRRTKQETEEASGRTFTPCPFRAASESIRPARAGRVMQTNQSSPAQCRNQTPYRRIRFSGSIVAAGSGRRRMVSPSVPRAEDGLDGPALEETFESAVERLPSNAHRFTDLLVSLRPMSSSRWGEGFEIPSSRAWLS